VTSVGGAAEEEPTLEPAGPEYADQPIPCGLHRIRIRGGKQVEGQSTIVVFVPKTTSPTPGWTITTYERQVMSLQDYLSERGYNVTVDEAESIEQALMKYTPSPTVTT